MIIQLGRAPWKSQVQLPAQSMVSFKIKLACSRLSSDRSWKYPRIKRIQCFWAAFSNVSFFLFWRSFPLHSVPVNAMYALKFHLPTICFFSFPTKLFNLLSTKITKIHGPFSADFQTASQPSACIAERDYVLPDTQLYICPRWIS